MLQSRASFALLLADKEIDILSIVQKISLRKQIHFNRCKLNDDVEHSYVLYTEPINKQYIFDMARNKKLKLVWKDATDFYVIDFSANTKGDIISYLSDVNENGEIIEGDVIILNLKPEFQNMKKVQLVSSKQIEDEQPYIYEHFKFYIKKVV